MEKMLEWFAALTIKEVSLILASVSLVMAALPFVSQIRAFINYIFGVKTPLIHEFFYSFSGYPNMEKTHSHDSAHDVKSDFFLVGTRLHLHWKVIGARKIDLIPVGSDLKGDTATVIIDPKFHRFNLKAYGFFGSMAESVLEIPKDNFRYLRTQALSDDTHLLREIPMISIRPLIKKFPGNRSTGKQMPFTGLKIVRNQVYLRLNGRPDLHAFVYPGPSRTRLYLRLEEARLLKRLSFSPRRYDEAVTQAKKNLNHTKP